MTDKAMLGDLPDVEALLANASKRRSYAGHAVILVTEQNGLCYYCEKVLQPDFRIDHKTPPSRGGRLLALENLAATCPPCNSKKGNRTEGEWRAVLESRTLGDLIASIGVAALCRRVGFSHQTLRKILRGEAVPYLDTALRVAEALRTDLESIEWPNGYLPTNDRPLPHQIKLPPFVKPVGVDPANIEEFARAGKKAAAV